MPQLTINDVSAVEGDAGTTRFELAIRISLPPAMPVTVDWTTVDDQAIAGSDYTAASGTATFTPGGPSTVTIGFDVIGDVDIELDERLFVELSNVTGRAQIADDRGSATIVGDDFVAEVTVRLVNAWSGGFTADLVIENTSDQPMATWTLAFDFLPTVTALWNGFYTVNGTRLTVTPETWNAMLDPGDSATLGLSADGTLTVGSVGDCVVNATPARLIVDLSGAGGGTGAGSPIAMPQVDTSSQATQVTIDLGASTVFTLSHTSTGAAYSVQTNNSDVVEATIIGGTLSVTGLAPGRAGLRIVETGSGGERYIGVRVRRGDGSLPGLPEYVSIGSVSEDSPEDLTFWRSFEPGPRNKRMDIRYIYLNGGPFLGWSTWTTAPGDRARRYIRESRMLGIIPFFVFYNIPDGGESYQTNLMHIEDLAYMEAYYLNLKLALDISVEEGGDDMVGFIFEPDFMGYMAQNHPVPPSVATARVDAAYSSGVLVAGVDPVFPSTLAGLVASINYITQKIASNVYFGWQMNLWASPSGGFTAIGVPGTGLMHHTDLAANPTDFDFRRTQIYGEATAITNYYLDSGIDTYGAHFVSIDKYGLDAAQQVGAAADPAGSTWFWNVDHWHNYLEFCRAMRDATQLPVILWQIPVGRINSTQATSAYSMTGTFPDLPNTARRYEDSSPTFFLGDTFQVTGPRLSHFSQNASADPTLVVNGDLVTWGEHVTDAQAVGIISIMFGAGVGISTDGLGDPPTEDWWWISKVQSYFGNPVPR